MISLVIPVYNEQDGIASTLETVSAVLSGIGEHEIIVVDDGSTDETPARLQASTVPGVRLVRHPHNLGYGKSLMDGISIARSDCIAIIDGDGSYPAHELPRLLEHYPEYDMVVGARTGSEFTRGALKWPARKAFRWLVEYVTGKKVPDINSGLRVFRKDLATNYWRDMCTGFSFTTNITLIAFLNHYFVKYVPIAYEVRAGRSKVRHFRDTLRAAQIIVQSILYYNPIKLFLLIAMACFGFGLVVGILDAFTLRSTFVAVLAALTAVTAVPVFCLGLLADLIRRGGIPRETFGRQPCEVVAAADAAPAAPAPPADAAPGEPGEES